MHIISKQGSADNVLTYEHICDTAADMAAIERKYITLGSVCIVLQGESGAMEVYMADSDKEWHDVIVTGGGSGSGESAPAGLSLYICTSSEVANGKPDVDAPAEGVLYLVPSGNQSGNLYDEYIYVNDAWELFGGASIDLTGYATQDWVSQQGYLTSHQNISGKADKTDTVLETTLSRGRKSNTTAGGASLAFGVDTEASGYYSVALGLNTTASSQGAFAEGKNTIAHYIAHAEGESTQALGQWAHSQGVGTAANGAASFAGGDHTIANGHASFVTGRYNAADSYDNWPTWTANTSYEVGDRVKRNMMVQNQPTDVGYHCTVANSDATFDIDHWELDGYHMNYVEIVGNGKQYEDPETHQMVRAGSNAYALEWDGTAHFAGDVYVGANSDSTGGVKVATVNQIPTAVSDLTNDSGYLVNADITDINTKVTSINNALYRINDLYTSKDFINVGFIRPAGTTSDSSSYAYTNYIYIGDAKEIIITGHFAASSSPAVFYDADKKYISGFTSTNTQEVTTYSIPVPENAKYVITSCAASRLNSFKVDVVFNHLIKNSSVCYISSNGNDSNDGLTPQTPVLSCSRATQILSQEGMLIMMAGDYDYNTIGLDFETTPNILGIDHPRIICYQQKIDNAELVNGYTKVYSVTKAFSYALNNATDFWQHDIPDARSIIPVEEAHPLNRNRTYRLPSTRISRVDSIEAIENSTEPSWYLDGTTFYFSIVEGSSLETNPVIIPVISGSRRYRYGSNNPINFSIKNIAIYYNCLLVDSACGMLDNVEIGMCYGDAVLSADYCESILLRNCNFYAVSAASGGDGVNVHNENDAIGHRSFVTLENCWLHDCADDGESCHGNSNTVHYGSLIEYNGTGVTPAGGGTTCNNVISRHNGPHSWVNDTVVCAGFSCQSSTSTLTCIGCFSYNNQRGYYCTASETNTQNCFTIINSIAKNNVVSGISVNRGTIIADNVQIIQTNNAPATFIQNGGTINFTGINSGIDSDGAYLQNNSQKYYIPFNAQIQITDTNPIITAAANTQYICGEVSTLSFTPAASGISDILFTSGSTATVLTIPNTVKFPEWFDPSNLSANTTYEISVMNGTYGAVMAWATT